jgi:hypothetical protein
MIDDKLEHIEETAEIILSRTSSEDIDENLLRQKVIQAAEINYADEDFSDKDIEFIVRKLQERFVVKMSVGDMFHSEDYKPWLVKVKTEINWYFWRRYKKYASSTVCAINQISLDLEISGN